MSAYRDDLAAANARADAAEKERDVLAANVKDRTRLTEDERQSIVAFTILLSAIAAVFIVVIVVFSIYAINAREVEQLKSSHEEIMQSFNREAIREQKRIEALHRAALRQCRLPVPNGDVALWIDGKTLPGPSICERGCRVEADETCEKFRRLLRNDR